MVDTPKIGSNYFIATDIYEVFVPVPVTLISQEDNDTYTGRWQLTEEYAEDYDGLEPRHLFPTEAAAWAHIKSEGSGTT